jgi:hypothetical protein
LDDQECSDLLDTLNESSLADQAAGYYGDRRLLMQTPLNLDLRVN